MSRGEHLIYTFELRTTANRRMRGRVTSASDEGALRRIADALKTDYLKPGEELASFLILEKFPKARRKQQITLNKRRAAKEAHKRKQLERIATYDGLTRID